MIIIKENRRIEMGELPIGDTFVGVDGNHYMKIIEVIVDNKHEKYNAICLENGWLRYVMKNELVRKCDFVLSIKE